MAFMNPIYDIRARLGVTQAAMAQGIGVTQGNVSNYERGQTMPPDVAGKLITYAKTLGHTITHNDIYAPIPHKPKRARAQVTPP